MKRTLTRVGATLGVTSAAFVGLTAFQATQAPDAHATICGYHTEFHYTDGDVDLPLIGNFPLISGEREIAYWGNCNSQNEQITVNSAEGTSTECVAPGQTRLGYTERGMQGPTIQGATQTGTTC
ncbi:DUF6355 family natural product biosynthesis protein [Nesterenkonia populi]